MTRFIIPTKVKKLEQRSRAVRVRRLPGQEDPVVDREDLGWFLVVEGGQASFFLGLERPDLKEGEAINVIIEPREEVI